MKILFFRFREPLKTSNFFVGFQVKMLIYFSKLRFSLVHPSRTSLFSEVPLILMIAAPGFFLIHENGFSQPVKLGKPEFDKTTHDFGPIREKDGKVEAIFPFRNAGEAPVAISNADARCGCTTIYWSRDSIRPHSLGFIKVVYDPANRPGVFSKSITVDFGKGYDPWLLIIKGNVIQRDLGFTDYYPFEDGNLRYRTNHVAFGELIAGRSDTASNLIYNQGKQPIRIDTQYTVLPPYLVMHISPVVIKPGGVSRARFRFLSKWKDEYGYDSEFFFLQTNDSINPRKRMDYSADIREDFSGWSKEEIANGPRASFDKVLHSFGDIHPASRVTATFKLTNTGRAALLLRNLKSSCGCSAAASGKDSLGPGESTDIEVSFLPGDRRGEIKKSIAVICNDPVTPVIRLEFTALVKEEKD